MVDFKEVRENLLRKIENLTAMDLNNFRVLTMSDFILDHTLYIKDIDLFFKEIKRVYSQGGGDFTAIKQVLQSGGCSSNTAASLGGLGVATYFIGRTSLLGKILLEFYIGGKNININNLKVDGNLGLMTIFEIGKKRINIMVGDPDSLSPLRYKDLDLEDKKLINSCNLVGVFGWAMNKAGTELANCVFDYAKKMNILTYLDTADPSSRLKEIEDLFNLVIASKNLDILSINENELNHYSCIISEAKNLNIYEKGLLLEKSISAKVNIHTSFYSVSIDNGVVVIMPTFKVVVKRTTGAGDMFNSGNILGYLLKLKPLERLMLANATACFFISSDKPVYPNIKDIYNFIGNEPLEPIRV